MSKKISKLKKGISSAVITTEEYLIYLKTRAIVENFFPKCFFPIGKEKPLKRGILYDLVERMKKINEVQVEEIHLKQFFVCYTTELSYRYSFLIPHAKRIDLDGNEVEDIGFEDTVYVKTRQPIRALVFFKETEEELKYKEEVMRNKTKANEVKNEQETANQDA